jgi:uncharacterized protein YggE
VISQQMVPHPWGVCAYGAASVKSKPDLVRVRFRIERVEKDPTAAFALVSEEVRAVREALRNHGVSDAAVDSSRLDLQSSWDWVNNTKRFLGYQCRAAFSVESSGLDTVQALLIDLVAAGANEIEGVEFDVTTKQQLRAQARQKAVAAARDKAELYASAAEIKLGQLMHIEDVDPEKAAAQRYRGHGSGGDTSDEALAPGHVVVSAAVVLGFSIVH